MTVIEVSPAVKTLKRCRLW